MQLFSKLETHNFHDNFLKTESVIRKKCYNWYIYVYFKNLQLKVLADFDAYAYGYNWKNSITWVNEYTTYFLKFDIEDCFIVAWLLYLDTFGKNVNSF